MRTFPGKREGLHHLGFEVNDLRKGKKNAEKAGFKMT